MSAFVLLCMVVAACEMPFQEYRSDAVKVENQSSQAVMLIDVTDAGSRIELGQLRPQEEYVTRQECIGSLIVESLAGEELAEFEGILCQGDPPLVISDELLEDG